MWSHLPKHSLKLQCSLQTASQYGLPFSAGFVVFAVCTHMRLEGAEGILDGGEQLGTVAQRFWHVAGIFYVAVEIRDYVEHCDDAGRQASDKAGLSV